MIIVLGIVVVIVIWYVSTMNGLRQREIKIDEALSGIDVALTKRYDVLTNSVETVKGYAKHEKELIVETIRMRQGMSMADRKAADGQMDELQTRIFALAENYPALQANENFKQLQKQIADCEEHLQAARRVYNSNVSSLNQSIVAFPTSIVANAIGVGPKDFFEADAKKKENVEIKF